MFLKNIHFLYWSLIEDLTALFPAPQNFSKRNGQYIYNIFFVKFLKKISLKSIDFDRYS